MSKKRYGWKGWRMPLTDLHDPEYCEFGCPICRAARAGGRLAGFFQRVELIVTRGGCWWGKARQAKYGVPPDEPLPPEK